MSTIPTLSRRRLAVVALFVAGFGLPVAAGFYSRSVSKWDGSKALLRFPPSAKSANPAIVDIARFGGPKRLFEPWKVRVYARVQNDSDVPRRVKVVLENCSLLSDWYVRDYTWNKEARAIMEALTPGSAFGIYLTGLIPRDQRAQAILCDGTLRALDPDSGALLASVPIRLLNSNAGLVANEAAQDHEGTHQHDGAQHN